MDNKNEYLMIGCVMKLVVISRTGDRSQVLHSLKSHTVHHIQSQLALKYVKILSHPIQKCIHKHKQTLLQVGKSQQKQIFCKTLFIFLDLGLRT